PVLPLNDVTPPSGASSHATPSVVLVRTWPSVPPEGKSLGTSSHAVPSAVLVKTCPVSPPEGRGSAASVHSGPLSPWVSTCPGAPPSGRPEGASCHSGPVVPWVKTCPWVPPVGNWSSALNVPSASTLTPSPIGTAPIFGSVAGARWAGVVRP